MFSSRRLALAAAAVILGLSACGSTKNTSGATTGGSTAGTTITTSPAGSVPSPTVIKLGGVGAVTSEAAVGAEFSAADTKMAMFANITYVFDGELPTLNDTGASWSFPTGAVPDQARVAAMAAALGVTGDVREVAADMGGGWMVGPQDYSAATLTVSTDGQVSWWFNPDPEVYDSAPVCSDIRIDPAAPVPDIAPIASSDVVVGAASADSAGVSAATVTDTSGTEIVGTDAVAPTSAVDVPAEFACPQPQPPVGVLGESDAIAATKTTMAALGYDAADYEFEFYGDEWSASVTAFLLLAGQRSPVTLSFGFGAEGAVTWASGSLNTPERGADYPLAGAQAGLDRLNDQAQQWSTYGYGFAGGSTLVRDATVSALTEPAASEVPSTEAPVTPAIEPAIDPVTDSVTDLVVDPAIDPGIDPAIAPCGPAVDCIPADAQPITIHLADVRIDLTMIWDADGNQWLLPAYTFTDVDGGTYSVLAVADEFVDLPATVDPVPAEPAPGESVPGESVPAEPAPEATVVEATAVEGQPDDTVIAEPVPLDQAVVEAALIGLSETDAVDLGVKNGWTIRVVVRDGEFLPATADYQFRRANVEITAGFVTAVQNIG